MIWYFLSIVLVIAFILLTFRNFRNGNKKESIFAFTGLLIIPAIGALIMLSQRGVKPQGTGFFTDVFIIGLDVLFYGPFIWMIGWSIKFIFTK